MYCEENYMTYTEDVAGCCDAVMFKLRKKRHFIMITLLLISAIVSLVAGMYNGLTLKKYSDMAILIGIFFPSIILVFICIYLAFICGRESFRSSVMSRIRHLSGHSRNNQEALQCPQMNSATRSDLPVSYKSKTISEFISDPVATDIKKTPCNKICCTADDSVDNCDAKISRKHFRSFSNPDFSKQMHKRHDMFYKKPEACKVAYTTPHDNQYSPRFQEHKVLNKQPKFKRSASDTANKDKYAKSREDEFVWNTQSLDKLRRHVVKTNSIKDATGQNDCAPSYEALRKPSHARKNYKSAEGSDKATRFKENEGYDQRYKNKQEYDNVIPREDIRKKTCYTKSEVHLYSSGVLKHPYEYKQTLHFSTFQPRGNNIKDVGEIASCSSSGGEKNAFSRSDTREIGRKTRLESENSINETNTSFSTAESDTNERERKSNQLEDFPSKQNRFRRKTTYFPSGSHKESAQPSREYAHEYCRHPKTKMAQQPRSRNENFEEHQSGTQERFHWRRMNIVESNEENM